MTATIIYPPQWRDVIIGPSEARVTSASRAHRLVQRVNGTTFDQHGPEGLAVYNVVRHKTYRWGGVIESFAWNSHAMVRVAFDGGPARLIAVPLGLLKKIDDGRAA